VYQQLGPCITELNDESQREIESKKLIYLDSLITIGAKGIIQQAHVGYVTHI